MPAFNCNAIQNALMVAITLGVVVAGCRQDAPPPAGRSLPSGIGTLSSSPVGGKDPAPGIDFCSYAASSGLNDFVFFIWGDFSGGAANSETKNKDGIQFHGHLIDGPGMRQIAFAGSTADGLSGQVTIEGSTYDLANGTLFLVSARRGYAVKQLKRDLSGYQDSEEVFQELRKSDPDVADFFRPVEAAK